LRLRESDRSDAPGKAARIVKDDVKSFGLSYEDAHNKDDWTARILANPRKNHKITLKTTCVLHVFKIPKHDYKNLN